MANDHSPLKEKSRGGAMRVEKRATTEEQAARLEVVLVHQQHLEELRECQHRLAVLVEGYLLALKQVDLCTGLRTRVGESVGKPQQLAEYAFWDGIRKQLDEIRSFSPDLAPPETKLGAAVQAFNAALEKAKAQVDEGAEEYAQPEADRLREIARSVLKPIREMTDSVSDIFKECPDETRNVLSQVASCIERILAQPRPDDSVRLSSQPSTGRPEPKGAASESKGQPSSSGWEGAATPYTQMRKGKAVDRGIEGERVLFKLQIAGLTNQEFEVRAIRSPMGEPRETGRLPFDPTDLIAVLKLLELGYDDPDRFSAPQREVLQDLGLVRDGYPVPDLLAYLGKGLYQALFPGKIDRAFQIALNRARDRRGAVVLQLRFDEDAVALARYPWELLHDDYRHLLSGGLVEMTRYIAYPEAVTGLEVGPPWRLLFIAPRPRGDLPRLPGDAERSTVWESLQPLEQSRRLKLESLDPPTYKALLDAVRREAYHILHFDGHGVFARRCVRCGEMHYPHAATCERCGASLAGIEPLGYLAFEGRDGNVDYVSTQVMENLLVGSEVRLAFLSACQSAAVRGETLFGGLGPGLIRAGVPAVVAMQLSVSVDAAVEFAQGFYTALAQGESVPRAVAEGRMGLFRSGSWYVPALYLRSTDDEGLLFVKQ